MRLKNLPYSHLSLLCFFLGVPVILGFTWSVEQMIGKEFPGWLGIGINLWSFAFTGLGFYCGVVSMWRDIMTNHKWVLYISRVRALSLLGMVLNGFWFLLYCILVVPMVFTALL